MMVGLECQDTYDSIAKTMHASTTTVIMNAHVQVVFGLQELDVILMIWQTKLTSTSFWFVVRRTVLVLILRENGILLRMAIVRKDQGLLSSKKILIHACKTSVGRYSTLLIRSLDWNREKERSMYSTRCCTETCGRNQCNWVTGLYDEKTRKIGVRSGLMDWRGKI
jgi:hypothetical protein